MSKTIGALLKAHTQLETTTLCMCWGIIRTDGTIIGFTDHDEEIVVLGVTCLPTLGDPSTLVSSSNLAVDNMDIIALLGNNAGEFVEADLINGLYDYATVKIYLVNWADLTQAPLLISSGYFGQVSVSDSNATLEFRSYSQKLQSTIGRVVSAGCDAELGDARCTVDLTPYTVTGTVTSVSTSVSFTDSSRSEATSYFNEGLLTWTSGLNNGTHFEVKNFVSSTFELKLPPAYAIQVGDTYSAYPGCYKTTSDCRNKYSNYINYQGFPDLPGTDAILSGA
jgi:uncharacterized phage protein (TIGR02218 family)